MDKNNFKVAILFCTKGYLFTKDRERETEIQFFTNMWKPVCKNYIFWEKKKLVISK